MLTTIKRTYKQIVERRSSQWPKVRKEHLKLFPTCAACGTKKAVEVHHKIPFSFYPEGELLPENFLTLCEYHDCHLIVGHGGNWADVNPYAAEDAALILLRIEKRITRNRPMLYRGEVREIILEMQQMVAI